MMITTLSHAVTDIVQNIHQHPFNQSLANGSLSSEVFAYYLEQDALYLADFSKALAITAARLPNNNQSKQFLQFSQNAIQAEHSLHQNYLPQTPSTQQSPACLGHRAYIAY